MTAPRGTLHETLVRNVEALGGEIAAALVDFTRAKQEGDQGGMAFYEKRLIAKRAALAASKRALNKHLRRVTA